ncbi:MAG: FadR/GntR family transcriptional regulator [Desulfuromonadaceae bacterium]|nr:FadR/GntR family transcriptional regulator [Desulfuromonadaceae bacterium]
MNDLVIAASTKVIDKSTSFVPLGRRKAYEEVADQIRDRIFAQQLQVLDRLPTERDLAEQFGVSRVVVREAIRTLELNGLLTVKKGAKGGLFVAQDYERPISESIVNLLAMGEASLENLFEVRELIEPFAAYRSAELGSEEDFEQLATLLSKVELENSKGDSIRLLNIEFHRLVIRMSRNPILSVVGETVLILLAERIKHIPNIATSKVALGMHKKILEAIRNRQPEEAKILMAKDIHTVGERLAMLKKSLITSSPASVLA